MEEKTKRKILFAGSVLIGIMFIFSYLGVSSNAPISTTSTTSTVAPQRSFFAYGNANATITGYAGTATLSLNTNSTAVANSIASMLSAMRNNGTVQNYVSDGSTYDVILGNTGAYQLQQILFGRLNSTNAVSIISTANARLDGRIPLTVTLTNQTVQVRINGTYQLNFTPLIPPNSPARVAVQALVTQNALVYNNQVTVTYGH